MSIQILTVRQFFETFLVFGVYCMMTLLLPAIFLYRSVRRMRFAARFMIYQTAGNFYMLFLVALLQFFHICGRATLRLFTLAPVIVYAACVLSRWIVGREEGQGGMDAQARKWAAVDFLSGCANRIWRRLGEMILLFIIAAVLLAAYDGNMAGHHSYQMSDISAYNSWIYGMENGSVSVGGPPRLFYGVIYFLYLVFGLDDFMLFRTFWIVQMILLYFMLLAFLRLCCKYSYSVYIGTGLYMVAAFLRTGSASGGGNRQLQEFGMLFVLASGAFLLLFFKTKKQELSREEAAQETLQSRADKRADGEEKQVFLLDDLLAQTAADEKAGKITGAPADRQKAGALDHGLAGSPAEAGSKQGEAVLIMQENEQDGTISIKECLLDGSISIQDASIEELAQHASEDIPLSDRGAKQGRQKPKAQSRSAYSLCGLRSESAKYLVFFCLAFHIALSAAAGLASSAGIFCVAVCIAYCFRLFRVPYLWRVLLAAAVSVLLTAVPVWIAASSGGALERTAEIPADMPMLQEGSRLSWQASLSLLLYGNGMQNLVTWLSLGLLLLLAAIFFAVRQTDYAAHMLAVVFYMGGLLAVNAAAGSGYLPAGDGWGCTRLYLAYSLVVVWGLCLDGVLWLLFYKRHTTEILS